MHRHPLRRAAAAIATAGLLMTLTACGGEEAPGSDEPVVIDITIKDGKVTPAGDTVKVGVNQPVDLVVDADSAGTLHVHSDPEHEFAYGEGTETFKLAVPRPGVVEVETHDPDYIVVKLEVR